MAQVQTHAVIFDLDGVITDTAEYHYLGWQQLADEEGLPFDREANEALRGLSRRESLRTLLGDHTVPEERFEEMLERKNRYYVGHLTGMSPADILPGGVDLVVEALRRGMPVAIGSSSKNARRVLDALELTELFAAIADGHTVERAKPAPDLFLAAAELLGVEPARCIVVEDAESGVDAALAAGMVAVGIGPPDRVGHAHHRFDTVAGAELDAVVPGQEIPVDGARLLDGWVVVDDEAQGGEVPGLGRERPVGDGRLVVDGLPGDDDRGPRLGLDDPAPADPWLPAGLLRWSVADGSVPRWPTGADPDGVRHELDLRHGRRHRRLTPTSGPVKRLLDDGFVARDEGGLVVHRQRLDAEPGTDLVLVGGVDRRGWATTGSDEALVVTDADDDVLVVEWSPGPAGEGVILAVGLVVEGAEVSQVNTDRGDDHALRRVTLQVGASPVVVRQVVAVEDGGAGSVERAARRARQALAAGHEPLLARQVIAWERDWHEVPATSAERCERYRQVTLGPRTGSRGP